jgi:selenocysteine-specific elongation factor
MILVVDITRGIQPQTAECIVIGEVCCIGSSSSRNKQQSKRRPSLIVALNKIDLIPVDKREKYIKKATKMVTTTLNKTKFAGSFVIVPVSALQPHLSNGLEILLKAVSNTAAVIIPQRDSISSPFLFIIDHCFAIKGQGTVVTGTVAKGTASVGDTIEFPTLGQKKKIKSMQAFHRPRLSCSAGDRLGICVSQLDAKLIERGVACAPGAVSTFNCAVALVEKVRYYEGVIGSRSRMHVIIGHSAVTAELLFFTLPFPSSGEINSNRHGLMFDVDTEYRYVDTLDTEQQDHGAQWALIKFSSPITAQNDSLLIGAKLDADISTISQCRLAFSGQLQQTFPITTTSDKTSPSGINIKSLKVYKEKYRRGVIERLDSDGTSAICKGMFSKDTDMSVFTGMEVVVEGTGEVGEISGGFGKSGKFRVSFRDNSSGGGRKEAGQEIMLKMKKYIKV